MRPFVEHDYEQNRIYEKQYLEYQDQLEIGRKERAEKVLMSASVNLSAAASWFPI